MKNRARNIRHKSIRLVNQAPLLVTMTPEAEAMALDPTATTTRGMEIDPAMEMQEPQPGVELVEETLIDPTVQPTVEPIFERAVVEQPTKKNNTLLYLALAAGAFFLLTKKKK